MKVTVKGQVTIPKNVRDELGIIPSETNVVFVKEESGKWFIHKEPSGKKQPSRFRRAHKSAKINMTTEEIMNLTRS
ncbi:MAG: AbrB/MazE/SpoVT family DNA-binding domain-containing protein [Gammaproteobacteria bacterium]|nr:AbrB/MazE/SpoVT family DNA-binding domain-containing protein [Gammaproteobacteria bacterium]